VYDNCTQDVVRGPLLLPVPVAEATRSSELFERRWGQRFEDVAGFVAWQGRRQRYVTARALGIPSKWANRISRWLARRRYGAMPSETRTDAVATRWFDELPGGVPVRCDGGPSGPPAPAAPPVPQTDSIPRFDPTPAAPAR
jgi:hypothetical protein